VLVQCCVCKKVLFDEQWREAPVPSDGHQIRSGYCPECYETVIAKAHQSHDFSYPLWLILSAHV